MSRLLDSSAVKITDPSSLENVDKAPTPRPAPPSFLKRWTHGAREYCSHSDFKPRAANDWEEDDDQHEDREDRARRLRDEDWPSLDEEKELIWQEERDAGNIASPHLPALELFLKLPRPHQKTVLRRCGGTGSEDLEVLKLALSKAPEETPYIKKALQAGERSGYVEDASGRLRWYWRKLLYSELPEKERAFMQDGGSAAIQQYRERWLKWSAAKAHIKLAEKVARACEGLAHVQNPHALTLLAATDEELLEEACRLVAGRQAVHEGRLAQRRKDNARRCDRNTHLMKKYLFRMHRCNLQQELAISSANMSQLSIVTPDNKFARMHKIIDRKLRHTRRKSKKILKAKHVHPRERDPRAQRRSLRREIGKTAAHVAGILSLVGGPPNQGLPHYVDDWQFDRWREVQEKGKAFLETHEIYRTENGEETAVSLAEVAESAARGREARWYAVLQGMQQQGERRGLKPFFCTLTLPGEYHLHAKSGKRGDPSISPTDAAKELNRRWHWALMMIHQAGTKPLGVRVMEPHRDGTPHLHACVWIDSAYEETFKRAIGKHFPGTEEEEERREKGDYTKGPAIEIIEIDPTKAQPASYCMKYVLKSIRSDNAETSTVDPGHMRAAAHMSHIGARRLSLIGLRPGTLTLWQSVQKLARKFDEDQYRLLESEIPRIRSILHAWQRQQWGTVLVLLGALADRPRLEPVRSERNNVWGDTVRETTHYIHPRTREHAMDVRGERWEIREIDHGKPLSNNNLSIVVSYPRHAAYAARGDHEHPPDGQDPPDSGVTQGQISDIEETGEPSEAPARPAGRLQEQADAIDDAIAATGLQDMLAPAPPTHAARTPLEESDRNRRLVRKLEAAGKLHRLRGTRLAWLTANADSDSDAESRH